MEEKMDQIFEILRTKSHTKQFVYRNSLAYFQKLKEVMQKMEQEFTTRLSKVDNSVEVIFADKGPFEAHLKFSGDTMVLMMHTNIFDFPDDHFVNKSAYIKEDPLREYCGLIQIYNFLSDSLKYNRIDDLGFLVARIFINKENHFFIEGKRPLSFTYNNIAAHVLDEHHIKNILEEAMLYCLRFDLVAPPVDTVNFISVEQMNVASYSSGFPTAKRLGFQMQKDLEKF